jgi:gamma-glutamyltranspeptidase
LDQNRTCRVPNYVFGIGTGTILFYFILFKKEQEPEVLHKMSRTAQHCTQKKTMSKQKKQSKNKQKQGVCHTVAFPFTFKSILRHKKNYGNSNIFHHAKI